MAALRHIAGRCIVRVSGPCWHALLPESGSGRNPTPDGVHLCAQDVTERVAAHARHASAALTAHAAMTDEDIAPSPLPASSAVSAEWQACRARCSSAFRSCTCVALLPLLVVGRV